MKSMDFDIKVGKAGLLDQRAYKVTLLSSGF